VPPSTHGLKVPEPLLRLGKRAVGLENLAEYLNEFRIPITAKEAGEIERLATAWGVARDQWSFIADLVP
jgi:hypothetical protein